MRQRIDYGDAGDPDQDGAARAEARARNLLGRAVRAYDEAGLVVSGGYDFKGNPLQTTRQVIADAPILATYTTAASQGWQVAPFTADWTPAHGQTQDARTPSCSTRPVHPRHHLRRAEPGHPATLPADVDGHRGVLTPEYNRAGALEAVSLDGTVYVQRISYDAKGQRTLIAYGNGVMTRYAYDPHTFRLARLRSEPCTVDGVTTGPPARSCRTSGTTTTWPATCSRSTTGRRAAVSHRRLDALDRVFTYDPVYRLRSATGREQRPRPAATRGPTFRAVPTRPSTQRYTETYDYDPVGNLLPLEHQPTARPHQRVHPGLRQPARQQRPQQPAAADDRQRHTLTTTPRRERQPGHRDHFPALHLGPRRPARHLRHPDRRRRAVGARALPLRRRRPAGHRSSSAGRAACRGHPVHRRVRAPPLVRRRAEQPLHVMDDRHGSPSSASARPPRTSAARRSQFHLADHLGSSVAHPRWHRRPHQPGGVHPVRRDQLRQLARKRYRFTGKERDEESGLDYHGARYYAPWLARWGSADPLVLDAGAFGPAAGRPLNPYGYCNASPLGAVDPDGRDVHILVDTSGRDIDYAGVATRAYEIENSPSFDPTKDAVYRLQVLDLGGLKGQIDAVRADAAKRGLGPTVEFSVWGHAGADGPVSAKPNSGPDVVDRNRMTIRS